MISLAIRSLILILLILTQGELSGQSSHEGSDLEDKKANQEPADGSTFEIGLGFRGRRTMDLSPPQQRKHSRKPPPAFKAPTASRSPIGKRLMGQGETDGKPDFSKLKVLELPAKK